MKQELAGAKLYAAKTEADFKQRLTRTEQVLAATNKQLTEKSIETENDILIVKQKAAKIESALKQRLAKTENEL